MCYEGALYRWARRWRQASSRLATLHSNSTPCASKLFNKSRRKDATTAGAKGGTKAPGRQERANWTACEAPGRHQGGRKGPFGQPGRHQGGRTGLIEQPGRHQGSTREAGKDLLDSLRGTREAPGRQERTNWTACDAPGRHQGGRKGPFGQPGRRQGGRKD